jgi:hypothetical protein
MLEFLRDKASERKLRLFVVGCARFVWDLLADETWREAVLRAECFADGFGTGQELDRIKVDLFSQWNERRFGRRGAEGWVGTLEAAAWALAICSTYITMTLPRHGVWRFTERLVGLHQPSVLRDIFGNPFRPVTLDPAWLSWHEGLPVSMAQRMYDSRDFSDMPVLADALEEAGCSDSDILSHCRQPGQHVRGCWLVDLLLNEG